jgi:kynurenine formamidase
MEAFQQAAKSGKAGTTEEWAPEHLALLSKNVPVVEGLTNLEPLLGEPRVQIVALPLKLKDGNGAPARVVALVY